VTHTSEHAPRAVVVGLGLIGTSVALGLRKAGWQVSGDDLDPSRAQRAHALGAIEAVGEDRRAQLAIVATPARAVPTVTEALFRHDETGRLVVTDVASVKAGIVAACRQERFVGGHPMAGSEQEGPDGADPDLFVGATWVLTPTEETAESSFSLVAGAARSLGADVVALSPERHDRLVAVVSHVPHLTAATLMALAADASEEQAVLLRLAAGGFRDMTRIAAGDPAIWPDIFRDNASAVLDVLDAFQHRLDQARHIVANGDRGALVELLERARHARRNLPPRAPRPGEVVEVRVPVPDRPGVLAEVTTVLGELGVNVADLEIAHSVEGDRGVLVLVIDASSAPRAREALFQRGYRPSFHSIS
jgi:prephenate dehydrogenase